MTHPDWRSREDRDRRYAFARSLGEALRATRTHDYRPGSLGHYLSSEAAWRLAILDQETNTRSLKAAPAFATIGGTKRGEGDGCRPSSAQTERWPGGA